MNLRYAQGQAQSYLALKNNLTLECTPGLMLLPVQNSGTKALRSGALARLELVPAGRSSRAVEPAKIVKQRNNPTIPLRLPRINPISRRQLATTMETAFRTCTHAIRAQRSLPQPREWSVQRGQRKNRSRRSRMVFQLWRFSRWIRFSADHAAF